MKKLVRKLLKAIRLEDLPSKLLLREFRRKHRSKHMPVSWVRVMNEYNDPVRKLHIGCGDHILRTWLNADFEPEKAGVMHLDARAPFPFKAGEFSYVFSEHMIEHIPYSDGFRMLTECYRVLKPNGKIRISTPDLSFLIALYMEPKTPLQKEYIKWSASKYLKDKQMGIDTFVINNFFRNWGHQFIYDEKVLRFSLHKAGFCDVIRCPLQESGEPLLRNLENEGRLPGEYLRLETLTMEGTKRTRNEAQFLDT
jgi:predicted SAM-dependent methyltransferase